MCKNENIEKIQAIRRRCGETQFRMAIQHLFDVGHENFTEKNVAEAKVAVHRDTPENAILTEDFQCELLDCCLELSRLPVWDILLYVKLYLSMDGDNLLLLEEAEQALSGWNGILAPQTWKAAVAEPDLRQEILQEMVREHHATEYTAAEINAAISVIAEES